MKEMKESCFIHFIGTVEREHRDLLGMKFDKEMSNNTVVSITEEKLP